MVDYSFNYCIDLRSGRCCSLDRQEFQHSQNDDSEGSERNYGAGEDAAYDTEYFMNLRKQSNLCRPSCPPVLFITDTNHCVHEAQSEGEPPDQDDDDEDQDQEDEEEFYDCEEDEHVANELGEEEEDREDRRSTSKRISSASRSPAPEHVQDGAQAEMNAEVEISEMITLRYSRLSLAHQPSLLVNTNEQGAKGGGVSQPILMPRINKQTEPEDDSHTMMKRYLIPICTIGEGAFGRVQLCQHRNTGRYYALKSMYIPRIVERRQIDHVHQEKRILQALDHPFIVKLWDTAKDSANLYMVMEFLPGGELFSYFRAVRKFPSSTVKFYAAEICLALEYLHSLSIAYRDLKLENLMVSLHGHIKLTDFGFAKVIHNKSYTLCGTPGYLAPEVFDRKGHNQSVDWWALGVLIYELMAGEQPFRGKSPEEIYQVILESKENGVHFPRRTFSPNSKEVVRSLLCFDANERMGKEKLKNHQWFCHYDWDELLNRNYKPPFLPTIYHDGDTGNFDSYQEMEQMPPAKQSDLDQFDDW